MRNPALCPVKCREVTVKKKRVETFRNIRYGDGRITIIYTDSAAAVSPPVGLAQARPNHVIVLERCRSSWGEPERGRADIGTQAGMHNTWMCGQMRLLATCLALSRVPIVCT